MSKQEKMHICATHLEPEDWLSPTLSQVGLASKSFQQFFQAENYAHQLHCVYCISSAVSEEDLQYVLYGGSG
jgi:hypothetical protein